ncbi:MAG TPA: transglutaminaseTgpA domain-containing protein [Candidatus Dormibacteraeota bacterium]|nr:transglutaminaseTgpA domain-containing protein [Candidatus Dormibacteraeota bacterium]
MASVTRLRLPASPVEHSPEARAFVWLAFAAAAIAVAIYGQDYIVPLVGIAAAAIGHVVSFREHNQRREFWRQVFLASLIFAALFYVIADSTLALFGGVLPQANFAILLVAITSFDLKTRRNLYSSLWISLAILYLAAVYAWDYLFIVFCALWVACLAGFWFCSHIRRIGGVPLLPPRPVALAAAAAFAVGLVSFSVIPQPSGVPISPLVISLPNFTAFHGDMESAALPLVQVTGDSAGATTSVDLHFRGRLGDSPVMYVRTGAPGYWRGLVFDTYRDGVWTASDHYYRETEPYVPPRLLPPAPDHNLGTFVQTFRVLRPMPGVIDAAYPIESLYAPVSALREDAYGTFHTPQQLTPGQTYSVVSYIPDLSAANLRANGDRPVFGYASGPYLDVTGLSSRARQLAAGIAPSGDQYDKVMAVTAYLQRNYRYTLDLPRVPAGQDPVDWFLFSARTGYCEQFATTEVLLLRSLNIAARLATGYSTGDYDPVLNQAVVRERDAHAWVEVWFPGYGWVPVDPTPGVAPLAVTQFPQHWAASGMARLLPHLTVGAPMTAVGSIGVVAAIPAAIGLVVLIALGFIWLRRRRPSRKPEPGESELLRLYERVQRRMRRRRAPPETPREYEEAMQTGLLDELTDAVNEGVYAGRWPTPQRVRELVEQISSR